MKVVYLAAGAGNMYCGTCLHGNTLVTALRAAGQDCLLAPMYMPLRTDEPSVSIDRVAFGGINVYLQQHSALFRHTPWVLDRLLDRPALLRLATHHSANVQPAHLGPLTVSMLEGEQGRQRKEVEKLVQWLERDVRPDVVHLNNAILIGVARQLMGRLGVPVVCTLSDEDAFLEKLPEPYHSQALGVLRQRVTETAALVAVSRHCADFMAEYLHVARASIEVVPAGINLAGHGTRQSAPRPFTIGYLSHVCPEKGLHLLAAALRLLAADTDVPPVRVVAAGYLDPADRPYLADILRQLRDAGLADRFQYVGPLDRAAKIALLQSLDLFCLPTVSGKGKCLSVLEAWANAVPAVLPRHGVFPEMINDTGGGILCEPNDPVALATALKRMMAKPDWAADCGRRAQQGVHRRYNATVMAEQMIRVYEGLTGNIER
jgi:glycosyltransferase involved in cell wall biosynthesis